MLYAMLKAYQRAKYPDIFIVSRAEDDDDEVDGEEDCESDDPPRTDRYDFGDISSTVDFFVSSLENDEEMQRDDLEDEEGFDKSGRCGWEGDGRGKE